MQNNANNPNNDFSEIGLLVADHINAMLAYWDKNLICRFANKSYLEWFGKNRDEMVGKITIQQLLGPLYEKNLPYITAALAGEQQTFEREIKTPTGEIRNSLANYYPHVVNNEVKGFFVHVADITPVKNIEKELIAALEREKAMNEEKSNFVSMASHELRTPLTAITSSLSLIDMYTQYGEKEKITKHLNRIKTSIGNLTEIINDYLSISKLEENKINVEYTTIDLPEFIDEVIQQMSSLLKKGQHIHHHHTGDLEIKQAEKIIRNTLINLLSNAIKYSEPEKQIHIYTKVGHNTVFIKVVDSGIGIPQEEQSHLFNAFFRANNTASIEGTGLGLSIVKRYINLLGGKINITSKVAEGTIVNIELPRIL